MQRSLKRDVRIYQWANLGFFVVAYGLARWLGGSYLWILAGPVVTSIVYGLFVNRRVRRLARIPARESALLLAGHLGREKLWGFVFVGFFLSAVGALFLVADIIQKRPLAFSTWWVGCLFVAVFLANSVLALRGLRMFRCRE